MFQTYIKDLKIQIYYLKKFYYNSASSWLKPDIEKCIEALNNELLNYELMLKKHQLKNNEKQNIQITIFDL